MTGEKYQALVIGKAKQPRCFNKIKPETLPVMYRANKKAWMNSKLFEEWLKKFDRKMRCTGRKVLLFLDNAPSHPHLTLSNVKLAFFPANTTSKTQPMDQGIIQTVKLKFRKRQLKFVINQMEKSDKSGSELLKEINVLKTIFWVSSSWNEVDPSTIQKCFARCGFDFQATSVNEGDNDDDEDDDIPLSIVRMSNELFGCPFKDLVNIDRDVVYERVGWSILICLRQSC